MVLAAPLPPSWNAHRRALRALGLEVDAADCFALGGGLGSLYAPGDPRGPAAPLCVGYGSLEPVEDLAIAVGAWVDQKHSASGDAAIGEMREHLARERTPVIAPVIAPVTPPPRRGTALDGGAGADGTADLDAALGDEVELEPGAGPRRTFASVVELADDRVVLRAGSSEELRAVPFAAWRARLDDARRWAVVISNGRFTAVRGACAALRRAAHRMIAGWRRHLGGLAALEAYLGALRAGGLDARPTLGASGQLGGGMGRALFAAFLDRHAEHLPAPVARLAAHFRELDAEWRELEQILAEGRAPGASLLQRISAGETAATGQMRDSLG